MQHRLIAAPLGSLVCTATTNAFSYSSAQNAPPVAKVGLHGSTVGLLLIYLLGRISDAALYNLTVATQAPLARFGVIADIQYANLADGQNYAKTQTRRYRGALEMVDKAVAYWAAQKVGFVAQLGDVIDGQCATKTHTSATDLASVLAKLNRLPVDYLNLIGNHELYNFDRPTLARELHTKRNGGHPPGVEREFYHTRPCKGWRVLVLDAYQVILA